MCSGRDSLRVSASSQYSGTCPSGAANCYQAGYAGLTELQQHGRDTWYFWTGGDVDSDGAVVGDQALWRILAVQSHGEFDLLQALDSRYRGERFKRFGVINDPDCRKASAPDRYGLWLDDCTSPDTPKVPDTGESTGVIGLRRFINPKFNQAAWSVDKYMADPATVEPPYLIGVACGFCHVGFNPLHPPADPENPAWHNLHPGIGNQYLHEQVFNTAKYPASRGHYSPATSSGKSRQRAAARDFGDVAGGDQITSTIRTSSAILPTSTIAPSMGGDSRRCAARCVSHPEGRGRLDWSGMS